MRRVVVTGAAGSLGRRVVARLAARPDVERVIGVDLADPPPELRQITNFDLRRIDLAGSSAAELAKAIDGADSIVHLAWRTPDGLDAGPEAEHDAAGCNSRAMSSVLAAAARARIVSLVFLSSATVYGAWPDNKIPITEDAPLRPNPELLYAVSKAEAERALAEWAEANPATSVAILRPAVAVGATDHPLYRALGATRLARAGEGRPVQYLHIDDLASAVELAWDRHLDGVFNVAPDAGVTEEQARALVGGLSRIALPERVAHAVAGASWRLWRGGVPPEARAYVTHPWVVASDRLKAQGWVPGHTSEEALVATDTRPHWDDLPPGRRQNLNLLVAAFALLGAAAGAAAVARLLRHRLLGGRPGQTS